MNTLAFGYVLPTTGRTPDLHRLETCAAGRTLKIPGASLRGTWYFSVCSSDRLSKGVDIAICIQSAADNVCRAELQICLCAGEAILLFFLTDCADDRILHQLNWWFTLGPDKGRLLLPPKGGMLQACYWSTTKWYYFLLSSIRHSALQCTSLSQIL